MIVVEEHLTRAHLHDGRVQKVMLHGTHREHADSIARTGLKPGGNKGKSHRTHIHIVCRLNDSGETPGVRGGSDVLVSIDIEKFFLHGGIVWWSANKVFWFQWASGASE